MLIIPSIFTSGMVLQRHKKICIWGSVSDTDLPDVRVSVCLSKEAREPIVVHTAVSHDGTWQCALPPQIEGGPFSLAITLYNAQNQSIDIHECNDVMIGEVWLAGGQSNMEYELCNDADGKLLLENPPELSIRYYAVPRVSFLGKELDEAEKKASWQKNGSPEMKHWSAAAYYAVKKMISEFPGLTFGIIGCNWGGSYAVNWMDVETSTARNNTAVYYTEYEQKIRDLSDEEAERLTAEYKKYHDEWDRKKMEYLADKPDASWKEILDYAGECRWPGPMTKNHEFRPGGLYETMIKRTAPFSLRGFLYYQGESDGIRPPLYFDLLSALVLFWRKIWKDDELYFMIFQITVYDPGDDSSNCTWAVIRHAQEKVFKNIKNTGLTVLTDWGNKTDIHPKAKRIPGERAGEQILHAVYGKPFNKAYSPLFRSFVVEGSEIRIYLTHTEDGLYIASGGKGGREGTLSLSVFDAGDTENPFRIWDESGKNCSAQVRIEKDPVTLSDVLIFSSSDIAHPSGASYGWSNYFITLLYNRAGFPASPFNTDYE